MSDKPNGSRKHKLTVSDRIVAVLLVVLALPMAPLMYLDGRLGWDGMPVICGVVVFWFVLIAGFWFMLGSFAPRYRGCRARAIFGRLGWWVMALMLCYLPFSSRCPRWDVCTASKRHSPRRSSPMSTPPASGRLPDILPVLFLQPIRPTPISMISRRTSWRRSGRLGSTAGICAGAMIRRFGKRHCGKRRISGELAFRSPD